MEQQGALDKAAKTPSARNKMKSCWEATALGRPTAAGRPTIFGRPTPGDSTSQIDCSRGNLERPDDRQTPDVRRPPGPRTTDATGRPNDQHPSRNYGCPASPDVRTVLSHRMSDPHWSSGTYVCAATGLWPCTPLPLTPSWLRL